MFNWPLLVLAFPSKPLASEDFKEYDHIFLCSEHVHKKQWTILKSPKSNFKEHDFPNGFLLFDGSICSWRPAFGLMFLSVLRIPFASKRPAGMTMMIPSQIHEDSYLSNCKKSGCLLLDRNSFQFEIQCLHKIFVWESLFKLMYTSMFTVFHSYLKTVIECHWSFSLIFYRNSHNLSGRLKYYGSWLEHCYEGLLVHYGKTV